MTEWMVPVGAAVGGGLLGVLGAWWWRGRSAAGARGVGRDLLAVDFQHVLELVRRVHGAQAACLVTDDAIPTISLADVRPTKDIIDRAEAAAREAMADGQDHAVDAAEIVAVGDRRVGVALVLAAGRRTTDPSERISKDLRRLVASFRVGRGSGQALRVDPREALDGALTRLESVEGLATALCEAARSLSGLPTAIALRDPVTNLASIVAVSRIADHRLIGNRVSAESACGRAIMGRMPTAGATITELVGAIPGDRRHRDEPGIAFPLHDGREGIGALVVFGQPDGIDPALRDRIAMLGLELAPHLSVAADVRAADARSLTDELTGLPNHRVLERTMSQIGARPGALLVASIDRFKALSDGFGHAGRDASLRHVGQILAHTLRDGDLAARSGHEEFALWLVGTGGKTAVDVAGRIRKAVAAATFQWAGADVRLTCSVGVASYPEPVSDLADVRTLAGAAARRARDAGGDRIEVATAPPRAAG